MIAAIASIPWWHFRERKEALDRLEQGLRTFNAQLDRTLETLPRASAEDLERELIASHIEPHRSDIGEPF